MALLVNCQYVTLLHYADISRYVHMAGNDKLVMNKLKTGRLTLTGTELSMRTSLSRFVKSILSSFSGKVNLVQFFQVCKNQCCPVFPGKVNLFCIVNIFVKITGSWLLSGSVGGEAAGGAPDKNIFSLPTSFVPSVQLLLTEIYSSEIIIWQKYFQCQPRKYLVKSFETTAVELNLSPESKNVLFPAGFEPATLCVWSTRDNRYTKETTVVTVWNICSAEHEWCTDGNWSKLWKPAKITIIPSGDRTQDLWIRSPTRYPLR